MKPNSRTSIQFFVEKDRCIFDLIHSRRKQGSFDRIMQDNIRGMISSFFLPLCFFDATVDPKNKATHEDHLRVVKSLRLHVTLQMKSHMKIIYLHGNEGFASVCI